MFATKSTLLSRTVGQLKLQSKNHRSLAIREFNLGFIECITDVGFDRLIEKIEGKRVDLDHLHLVDLLARAFQYKLRAQNRLEYVHFSKDDWVRYFKSLTHQDLEEIATLVEAKSVATHVPSRRYRAMGALCAALAQKKGLLRVADWGCSLNLGLPAILAPGYLMGEVGLEDGTPGQIVTQLLLENGVGFERAVGVDKQESEFAWALACVYFSEYDQTKLDLEQDMQSLAPYRKGIITVQADIAADGVHGEELVHRLRGAEDKCLDVIYASMVMYQLSGEMKQKAWANAEKVLCAEHGVFMELNFRDEKNWFKKWNAASTVRFMHHGKLGPTLEWLVWDSSRCAKVKAGRDFARVNSMII